MGNCLLSEILADYNLALNILINHELVEEKKVGALGHSFGGNTILFHAALDTRFKFVCASGSACTVKTKQERETGLEFSLLVPGFFNEFDIDSLVENIAPRKLLLTSGTHDPYSFDASKIYDKTKHKWVQAGLSDAFNHISFDGGHELDDERFKVIVSWVTSNCV